MSKSLPQTKEECELRLAEIVKAISTGKVDENKGRMYLLRFCCMLCATPFFFDAKTGKIVDRTPEHDKLIRKLG